MPKPKRPRGSGPARARMPEKSSSKDQFGWWFRWCNADDPVTYWKEKRAKRR